MNQPTSCPEDSSATVHLNVPNHLDLYVLIVGILAGVLLGPGVLGQIWPGGYDRLWVGSGPGRQELVTYDRNQRELLTRLEQSGVTAEAVIEKRAAIETGRIPLEAKVLVAQKNHRAWLQGRAAALVLAVLVIMVIEAMLSTMSATIWQKMRHRLVTLRYALMAVWITLLLAEPAAITEGSMITFVALLVSFSLLIAYVPLPGWKGKTGE